MMYLPSVMATATMLHVINGVAPSLGLEYQDQLLGILGIKKVATLFFLPYCLTEPSNFAGFLKNLDAQTGQSR